MRKLVSVQTIRELHPIDDADAIEVAKVLGWSVVVKKGEFQVGEKVVYAEIDSVFPEKEEYEFLRNGKFRIRTIKLRGQVSQGICFPLSVLPEGEYEEDQEVTELLGVVKYDPPIPACLDGIMKGRYPSFITKTDETRVQVLQHTLTQNKGAVCVYSEKLDGVSTTFYLKEEEFGVCTHNLDLFETEGNTLWMMAHKYNVEEKLRGLGRNLALQGETIGSGIQKNKYKLPANERQFFLFNIFDIDAYRYLDYDEFMEIAKRLDIQVVPFLHESFILSDNIDELIELSKGYSVLNKTTKREGIVIKIRKTKNRDGLSFKAINPEFLLKFNDE
jgi:RNA ligase (TIGR02306 family)